MINSKVENNFLNRKRILLIIFGACISIALIVLSFTTILHIHLSTLFGSMSDAVKLNATRSSFIIISFLLYVGLKYFILSWLYTVRAKKAGIYISTKDRIIFAMTMFVLIPFTPANFITSPYTIWWLKKRGFTTPEAAAQTLVDTLLWQLIQMIISLSSFITITYHIVYTKDIEFTSQVEVGYWFIVGGIVMDWVILVFLFVVGFSVHIHLWISLLSNKIKKIMHLSYSTSAETRKKYLEDKVIKNKFKELLFKDWKITLFVIGAYACWEICTYSLLAGGLELVKADESISISFIKVFDVSNVSNTATKFMPVPGEEGLIQWMMSSLFSSGYGISGINDHREIKEFTKNGITIWRFFTTYIPLFIGLSYFLIFYICKAIKKYIIK